MSGKSIGWGFLGAGRFVQRRILPVFKALEGAQPVALQRRDAAAARETALAHGIPGAYASRTELLADPAVDAVFVGTPNGAHLDDVLAAADAGKHVLVEKPMGLSTDECRRMIASCEQAGVQLFVGQCLRYMPAVEKTAALLKTGALGPLERLAGVYSFKCAADVWRRDARIGGGGPLMDLAPHLIDLFRYLTGKEIMGVQARVIPDRDLVGGRAESHAHALLGMEDYLVAHLDVSFDEAFRNGFECFGRDGTLRGDYVLSEIDSPHARLHKISADPGPPNIEEVPLDNPAMYLHQMGDVTRALLDDAYTPRCATGVDGLRTLQVIEAIYEAGRTGRCVPVVVS